MLSPPTTPEPVASAPVSVVPPAASSTVLPQPSASAAVTSASLPRSLRPLWSLRTKGQTATVVDIVGEHLIVFAGHYVEFGSPTRWVLNVEAATGRVRWERDFGSRLFQSQSIEGGVVLLESPEGKPIALDLLTGAATKKRPSTRPAPTPPAQECTWKKGELTCFEPGSSAALWSVPVAEPVSKIAQPEGLVCYARARVLTIECREARTGSLVFEHSVPRVPSVKDPEEVHFSYRVIQNRLFVGNYDGTVAAFEHS